MKSITGVAAMNGHAIGNSSLDDALSAAVAPLAPLNSYKKTAADEMKYRPLGPNKAAPRSHNLDAISVPHTTRMDLKDPIQVHLLTETALADSKSYEILTQEEVDELKKESQLLRQRVEVTRANLAIQSKYRDAAVSMAKLYKPAGADGRARDSGAAAAMEEKESCERKCDELAAKLLDLKKQLLVPQRRILEHTAGILQLTHKASAHRRAMPQNLQFIKGIPGSPESLYTYSLSRNSVEHTAADSFLEDPTLQHLDLFDGPQARKHAIDIPVKSPIRKQNQLRGEVNRMREENLQLRGQMDMFIQRLQHLNGSLREAVLRFNPAVNGDYEEAPTISATAAKAIEPMKLLKTQMDYLEGGLVTIHAEQDSSLPDGNLGSRIQSLSHQMCGLLSAAGLGSTLTPPPTTDVGDQLSYLEGVLQDTSSLSIPQDGRTEPILVGLFESIQQGFVETKQRKDDRRRTRSEKGLPDEEDLSEDEAFDSEETYFLAAFATRIQWLRSQTSILKDQKYVLKRQIKQQRELNNKSDAEKDKEMSRKEEQLEQNRLLLAKSEKEAFDAQRLLSDALQDLEDARATAQAGQAAQVELDARDAKIRSLEANLRELQGRLAEAESESMRLKQKLADIDTQLISLAREKDVAEESAQQLRKELDEAKTKLSTKDRSVNGNEDEMKQLNMTIAELKTEVTIARAELDGAYGSRAERAAEVAAIKNSAEAVKLQNQVDRLKRELSETVQELEGMTKETIGAEREKLELEARLDEALSVRGTLEAELQKYLERMAKLQEDLDAEKLKAGPKQGGATRPGAGASMLSEQFRATMKEERKKFQEDLKEERMRSRKLEDELIRLKRPQGAAKKSALVPE